MLSPLILSIVSGDSCHCPNWYGCIMSEKIVGQDGIQPYRFSDCSRKSYFSSINSGHAMCLINKPNTIDVRALSLHLMIISHPLYNNLNYQPAESAFVYMYFLCLFMNSRQSRRVEMVFRSQEKSVIVDRFRNAQRIPAANPCPAD